MKIDVIKREEQADGQFNGGAILEKRPVVYQSKKSFPYSNLFYWAHAWSDNGSTIGLHPHQGFEILSFILKGEIEHYDTKNQTWKKLREGDVQIIRSGNGISHAEKLLPASSIFQIWFDPDLNKSLTQPASYDDYESTSFPVVVQNGITTRIFKGDKAPIQMETEGISIKELTAKAGKHSLPLDASKIYSVFLISGSVTLGDHQLRKEDFAVIKDTDHITMEVNEESRLFIIESPLKPSYKTYIELNG